jgi:hypothetical protein
MAAFRDYPEKGLSITAGVPPCRKGKRERDSLPLRLPERFSLINALRIKALLQPWKFREIKFKTSAFPELRLKQKEGRVGYPAFLPYHICQRYDFPGLQS